MTKVHVHVRITGAIAAAAACLLLAGACARTTEQRGTGETHFLSTCTEACGSELSCLGGACTRTCEEDDACASLAAGATCEAPALAGDGGAVTELACDVLCEGDQDCDPLGADFSCMDGRCRGEPAASAPPPEPPSCPSGCVAVNGYGEDPGRGCVDRARLEFVACDCNPAGAFPHCGRRTSDDTLWVFHYGELSPDSEIADCTPAESERVQYSCEFAACEVPPLSICTLEATCSDSGCGSLVFDAQGCRRPECTTNAECDGDERCVLFSCFTASWCTPSNPGPNETCGCSGPAACVRGGACNPVGTVGPGGDWQSLELIDTNPFCTATCPEPAGCCSETRTVDAAGALTIRPMGSTETRTAMLSQEHLAELELLVDGPSLRIGLRDGFGCGVRVSDVDVELRLVLPDQTLSQSVGQCTHGYAPDEHELARLREMLWAY